MCPKIVAVMKALKQIRNRRYSHTFVVNSLRNKLVYEESFTSYYSKLNVTEIAQNIFKTLLLLKVSKISS